jgi:hypothetical protein
MSTTKPPAILDKIVDLVLAYKPKPKSKAGKKRKRLARKLSLPASRHDEARDEKDREH